METRITVRAHPGAIRSGVMRYQEGIWHISITAPAASGKANRALVNYLAELLDIPKQDIEIERGLTGRTKLVRICGLTEEEATRLIKTGL
ncbi:MAG: DUF167 domain-containing protein [Chloroflexota bacterium]